jgi:tRNA A37 methylthiotransferase MiaB
MLTHFQQRDVVEQDIVVATPKNKLKILFYHAGGHTAWLYPAALQLKTYIDLFYQDIADQLEWLVPIQQEVSDEELIEHIKQTDADILCTSHYLWNHEFLTAQLSRIRHKLKHTIKVVAGGPSIDVNNNHAFFEQHPYIDYAVYSAGEQAFADIVDHLVNKKQLIAFNTSNCAWKNNNTGKTVVADYKFVKMIETSPFIHNKDLFSAMVIDAKKKNAPVWLPYTLTRGCPYSCTFCDWNSGLGNKVSRRKNTYQQEIDLFQQLGVTNIYLSDANVGQYTEDVEMIDYFAQKNLKENAGFHVGGNFSKLKKENNLKIFNIMARGSLVNKTLNFSVQDINQQVLDNIDRPDVGWETHVAMANELRENYPHLIVKAQLIYGLPGQTPATWQHTLEQVTQQNILPVIFLNEPLPASPAIYDPEYQRKFQYEYVHSNRILGSKIYSSKIPKRSNSFDQADLVQMNLLSAIYLALSAINFAMQETNSKVLNTAEIVDDFLNSVHYKTLYNNLYHNWTVENNFYYTVDFSGNPTQIPDLALGLALATDISFLKYISTFLLVDNQREFLKMAVKSQFQKMIYEIHVDVD